MKKQSPQILKGSESHVEYSGSREILASPSCMKYRKNPHDEKDRAQSESERWMSLPIEEQRASPHGAESLYPGLLDQSRGDKGDQGPAGASEDGPGDDSE